jgi:hypothetical protein
MSDVKTMRELLAEVEMAQVEYIDREREATVAERRRVDALNRLNTVQRQLGEAMDAMRRHAPAGSDWRGTPARLAIAPATDRTAG